jgi:site-specific recombinase
MSFLRSVRRLSRRRRLRKTPVFAKAELGLHARTAAFCAAATLSARTLHVAALFGYIWNRPTERGFITSLLRWIRLLEQDKPLRARFDRSWREMLAELDSVPLFADAGLPIHYALLPEAFRRLFQRLLPSAREESDTARLFTAVFRTATAVQRFLDLDNATFVRLARILWPSAGLDAVPHVADDILQSLSLLATRVAGRGVTAAVRARGSTRDVEASPFYQFVFATQSFLQATELSAEKSAALHIWFGAVRACRREMIQVRQHMEDAGVSTALVFDLTSMDASLDRMQLLASAITGDARQSMQAARQLLNTLVAGRLEDTRLSPLIRQNLNLLARKTVERTGHSGEHYIANNRHEYWQMWLAALGGGLLTVFTAAIKLRIMEGSLPLFVTGFLVGTDYAISFILLQVFGLALATKQPSATGAALAGIVRENRGVSRWSKIADFAARISRTQLAAALGNVTAVCLGAVAFEQLWQKLFLRPYLPNAMAMRVYETLHPFTSATAIDAAITGVLLWAAAVIGGWSENLVVYNRIPAAIAQHPLGQKIGARRMQRLAGWFENNIASWSTSIVLGYMMGFFPEVAHFFGLPLDVRHVTLNTGMLALSAARYGVASFGHYWFYFAVVGIGIIFVLNLGVSFAIASLTALRAYNVRHDERAEILKYLLGQVLRSPLRFILPIERDTPPIVSATPASEGVNYEGWSRK